MRNSWRGVVGVGTLAVLIACAGARDENLVEAGRAIAEENCARCHAIGQSGESPMEQAPPFRRIQDRYAVDELAEAFAEGIVLGHTEMPEFTFDQSQINAVLAYLKSLESRPQR